MARKVEHVTITAEGRDKGKVFVLTEMPSEQSEAWATRVAMTLMGSGVDIGEAQGAGLAGIAMLGFKALGKMKYEDAAPLLKEMFECVRIMPDPNKPEIVRNLLKDEIEEIATRLQLRMEVFKLHTDFSFAASLSGSVQAAGGADNRGSLSIKTSRRRLAR